MTTIPDWFTIGLQFTSKWINNGDNTCIVLGYSIPNNTCEVEVQTPVTKFTEDNWNLQHTIWGFNQGDYFIIEEESFGQWYNSKQD